MKRVVMIGVFALMLGWLCVPLVAAQDSIEGDWVGGSNLFGNPAFVQVRFTLTSSGVGGITNIQSWKVANRPLTVVKVESSRVQFEFPSTTGIPFMADGQLKDGVIQGTMRRGETQGKFHLIHVAKVDRKLYDGYVGAYEFPDPKQGGAPKLQLITYGAQGYLRWVNLETGQTSALFPISDNKFFFAGTVAAQANPEVATWSFERGEKGEVTSKIRISGQPDQQGPRTDVYKQEEVSLRNGDVTLAATLLSPATKARHPAVVYIQGSQAESRDSSLFRDFHQLLLKGIAVLIYDKRGTGGSSGDWQRSSFENLADDALAGVAFLKTRKDINPKQIGVWGFSQGATIAPLAASRSKDVAFVIMMSGGGIGPADAEKYQQLGAMRARKLSDDEIKEGLAFIQLEFDAVRSPAGFEKFQAALPRARNARWGQHLWGGLPRDDWRWGWWSLVINHDPALVLEKVKVPVLALFGGADSLTVPEGVNEMIAKIEQSLKKAGNKDVTTKIFPGAEHDLNIPVEGGGEPPPAPEFHATVVGWLLQRVTVKK